MMEQNTTEFEYLALVINYNEFLEKTILRKEYFEGKERVMFEIFVGRTCGNRNHIFWFVARYSIHYTKVLLKWHSLRESNTLLQIWSLRHNTHIPRLLVARLRVELRSPVSETRVQAVIPPGIKWSECHASSMISPSCSHVDMLQVLF